MTPSEPTGSSPLHELASALGVASRFRDGLGRHVTVSADTLVAVCRALGAEIEQVGDAVAALASLRALRETELVEPVLVAWDGRLRVDVRCSPGTPVRVDVRLENGTEATVTGTAPTVVVPDPLPFGYHHLTVEADGRTGQATAVAAPEQTWGDDRRERRWGVAAELAALRSTRSRSVGDLHDLQALAETIAAEGGDLVSVLPILPTYDDRPIEPSPYSPVSRLFWSDLVVRLDDHPSVTSSADLLDFEAAGEEVRTALRGRTPPPPSAIDPELARYASFRGAQARLGRDWRTWPSRARGGELTPADVDPDVERHHLVAQTMLRGQLDDVSARMADIGVELGLDLAVGVHPTGYDVWSRQTLFAEGIEVGAPADLGFPSGQSWGFAPILPEASRQEGHAYVAASVAHQAAMAGVLRIDHVMAMSRLYWIPSGLPLTEGTYVEYPTDEMFAVLSLESHRHECCLVGENLGTVPADIDAALTRHGIWGMYLAQFAAGGGTAPMADPAPTEVAMIGTHDTPTLAGWLDAIDVGERIRMGLLDGRDDNATRTSRRAAAELLAEHVGASLDRPDELLDAVLTWLGESASPLVVVWLEDLWLEADAVNLPGTSAADRPNWQRPMARLLDDALADPEVRRRLQLVAAGRRAHDNK